MDLWGPGPVISLSGHCYLCGGTDEYSRCCWLRGITAKSDATRAIQDLVAFSCVQYPGSSFRTLVADRGGEFVNKQLDGWLASQGFVHELSAPYKHGQMGLQERSWRSIFDKVCTSLAQSGLPLFLWEEAAHAAVYTLNLTATPVLNNLTPDLVLHTSGDPVAHADPASVFGAARCLSHYYRNSAGTSSRPGLITASSSATCRRLKPSVFTTPLEAPCAAVLQEQ